MIAIPVYADKIIASKVTAYTSLEYFIEAHRNPKPQIAEIIHNLRHIPTELTEEQRKEFKADLKKSLPSVTPSVLIEKGNRRKYEFVRSYTGLMQLDFDKMESIEQAEDFKRHLFDTHEEIICAYISPSGKGVKALMKIKQVENKAQFHAIFHAVAEEMEQYPYFDKATKNAVLPLFISVDPNILARPYESTKTWTKENWESVVEYIEPKFDCGATGLDTPENQARIVEEMTTAVNSISPGNGHTTVLHKSCMLGHYVSAGYLSQSEAEALMLGLVESSPYLSGRQSSGKLSDYRKTAIESIAYGIAKKKWYLKRI